MPRPRVPPTPINDDRSVSIALFSMGYAPEHLHGLPVNFKVEVNTAGFPRIHIWTNAEPYKRRRGEKVDKIHTGEHYINLHEVITDNQVKLRADFTKIKRGLHRQLQNGNFDINIGFMCKQGRHQSISICRVISEVLMRKGFTVRGPIHLHEGNWLAGQCWRCDKCDPNYRPKWQLYRIALDLWNSIAV